jgi:hypothetical protein
MSSVSLSKIVSQARLVPAETRLAIQPEFGFMAIVDQILISRVRVPGHPAEKQVASQ